MIDNLKNTRRLFFTVRGCRAAGVGTALMAGVIFLASAGASTAGDTNAPVAAAAVGGAKDPQTLAKPGQRAEARPKKELSGAELYAIHCNRCHAERYPAEFTDGQWKTLMLHMRVRANLPASQAKAILKYLQEDAGN